MAVKKGIETVFFGKAFDCQVKVPPDMEVLKGQFLCYKSDHSVSLAENQTTFLGYAAEYVAASTSGSLVGCITPDSAMFECKEDVDLGDKLYATSKENNEVSKTRSGSHPPVAIVIDSTENKRYVKGYLIKPR